MSSNNSHRRNVSDSSFVERTPLTSSSARKTTTTSHGASLNALDDITTHEKHLHQHNTSAGSNRSRSRTFVPSMASGSRNPFEQDEDAFFSSEFDKICKLSQSSKGE